MQNLKMLITIEEGLIQTIHTNNPDIQVCVIDNDCFENAPYEDEEENIQSVVRMEDTLPFNGVWASLYKDVKDTEYKQPQYRMEQDQKILKRLTDLDAQFPAESEPDQKLVDKVIEEIKQDIQDGDLTVLDELLKFVPEKYLKGYLHHDKPDGFVSDKTFPNLDQPGS